MRLFVSKIDATRLETLNAKEELTDTAGTRHKIGSIVSVVYTPQNEQVFILFTSDGEVHVQPNPIPQQQPQPGWQQPPIQQSPYRPQQYPQQQPGWQQPWGGGGPWNGVVS